MVLETHTDKPPLPDGEKGNPMTVCTICGRDKSADGFIGGCTYKGAPACDRCFEDDTLFETCPICGDAECVYDTESEFEQVKCGDGAFSKRRYCPDCQAEACAAARGMGADEFDLLEDADAWAAYRGKAKGDTISEMDGRLNHVRAAFRAADATFSPDPDADMYASGPDGRMNMADLLALAPDGMDAGDFERRVLIMYNGTDDQRGRLLEHWDDAELARELADDVERDNAWWAPEYDLLRCDMWEGA